MILCLWYSCSLLWAVSPPCGPLNFINLPVYQNQILWWVTEAVTIQSRTNGWCQSLKHYSKSKTVLEESGDSGNADLNMTGLLSSFLLHRPCLLLQWLWASTAPPLPSSSSLSSSPTIACTWCSTRARQWSAAASLTSAKLRRRKVMPQTPACPPASGKNQKHRQWDTSGDTY